MENLLRSFFECEKIEYFSCLDTDKCRLLYPGKLPAFAKSVCFFLIPYFARDNCTSNISLYAVPRDYHLYIRELEARFEKLKAQKGIVAETKFFSDNSPFDERYCAELAGLGNIGKNGLLINPVYGSFVFIGCICTADSISISQTEKNFKGDICGNCELCLTACPHLRGKSDECLSALTQKKRISDSEKDIISSLYVKWGCDICQLVCPYNRDIPESPAEFFKTDRIPRLTKEVLENMPDSDFKERAYSWRGRQVILRNLEN